MSLQSEQLDQAIASVQLRFPDCDVTVSNGESILVTGPGGLQILVRPHGDVVAADQFDKAFAELGPVVPGPDLGGQHGITEIVAKVSKVTPDPPGSPALQAKVSKVDP